MVRESDLPRAEAELLAAMPCPTFEHTPWVRGGPMAERNIALLNSAGLIARGERPLAPRDARYRTISHDVADNDVLMSHVSVNFDRTGFQRDLDSVLPRTHFNDLVSEGAIRGFGSASYSFMGATPPEQMQPNARKLAQDLLEQGIDSAFVVPV